MLQSLRNDPVVNHFMVRTYVDPDDTDGVIGYIVDPRAAGQCVGTATARALLRAAFSRHLASGHTASQAVQVFARGATTRTPPRGFV